MQEEKNYRSPKLVIWFTGLSGSGKSTLAEAVYQRLQQQDRPAYVLDGDALRGGLCSDLGFDAAARTENNRRAGHVARLMTDAGLVVLGAFISPFAEHRALVRGLFAPGEFIEVHCDCPLEECERRDVKGLYRRARAGQITDFTGISSPYETPLRPELVVDTSNQSVDAACAQVLALLSR
ncbi:adenylyl-sulfate kinase [Pseudoduganella sp. FT26W]|uniref:Adenylyl-sulfate kinase n=1 Tax=Duganella aquatilis TaxID=2666082 RepID=A0A844CZQ4_9BURK|nr:adenylyl-sulfate kinase [Duganella aquatilis]MRW86297.1 adenylyl-sulfate kinase [Duganella aquatilis]